MITDKIDKITKIADAATVTPPCPKAVKIELTARCDLNCAFCATNWKNQQRIDSGLRQKGNMEWEFYERIVPELVESGVKELGVFFLGESLLVPWLGKAIKYAKDCGIEYVFLTTNGRMLTPAKTDEIIRAGLDSLKVSLNFNSPSMMKDKVGKDDFTATIGNMFGAKKVRDLIEIETGHRCGFYASSILYEETTRADMVPFVQMIQPTIDEHYFLPLYSQAGITGVQGGGAVVAGNPGRADKMRDPLPCWACFTEARITWDGNLSACCFDHNERFHMGDLNKMSFLEAWGSKEFQELRAAHLAKNVTGTACERCIAYDF